MSRFRFFLPFIAPVLVVIGWWWHMSRKKKEMATLEEDEGTAVCEALNGVVESSGGRLKVKTRSGVGLVEENRVQAATSGMISQLLDIETLGRVETSSRTHHSSLTVDPDAEGLESSEQATPHEQEEQATPHEQEEQATPHEQEEQATPHEQEEQATPHKQEEQATPHKQEEQAAPHEHEELSTPHEQEEQATPHKQEEQAMPHEQEEQAMPHEQEEQATPHEQEEQATPHKQEEQTTPHEQAATNTGGDEAEVAEKRTSEHQSLHNDKQLTDAFESGTGEELAAEQDVVAEEEGALAPPPSHLPGAAISLALAQLTEPEPDRTLANESIAVPSPDHLCLLPVPKDQIFTSETPDVPCPNTAMASYQVPTMMAPPSNVEAEGTTQQDSQGGVLQSGLVLDPVKEKSSGPAPSLNSEVISMETGEGLAVRPYDVSEEGYGRPWEARDSFPPSSEPQCTVVDQVEQDSRQMPMELLCRLDEVQVDNTNEQTSNEMRPLLEESSSLSTSIELAKDEEVLSACNVPPIQEEVEDSSSGRVCGRKGVNPEDSPSGLDEPQTDVTGTEDSGCSTGQLEDSWVHPCESTGEEVDGKPSDQNSEILDTQTESPCAVPDLARQEDGVQHRSQGLFSVTPTEAPWNEVSQNGRSSPPVHENLMDVATDHSGMASLQKSLGPEATLLSRDEPQKDDDVTGADDSGSSTCQSEDGVGSEDRIPFAVPEREQNTMPISAMSQDGLSHSPERWSEPSAEEGHQGSHYVGETVSDTDIQTGNDVVHEMEGGRSEEISSENPLVSQSECADDRKSPDRSSGCIPGAQTETWCPAEDQAAQEDALTAEDQTAQEDGVQHRLEERPISVAPAEAPGDEASQNGRSIPPVEEKAADDVAGRRGMVSLQKSLAPEATLLSRDEPREGDEGPFSAAPTETFGNDASRRSPVREEPESVPKNPGAGTAPSRRDGPQTLEDVSGTEDPGCSTCQSEDGVRSRNRTSSTGPQQEEDLTPVSTASRASEKQREGPERKSEPPEEEGRRGNLPRGERLRDTDLQNGSLKTPEGGAELSEGPGESLKPRATFHPPGAPNSSDVNGVNTGCSLETGEDQGHSGQPTFPQNPDLTVWEIEVPKLLVGRLIGKRGRYVSFLKQTSGAKVFISPRPDTQEIQLCHIEGTKQQVHKAVGLIRKKFKDLDLTNRHAPPPHSKLPSLPITSWLLLPDEATVEVTVVKIVSASHMFVQQPKHPSYPALGALDDDMRLCYSRPAPGLPSPTEAGVICAAPGVDGAWRRAQVISFHKECDEAEVRYVDYGGYCRVKMDALHQIRSDFVTLPFQGAEVALSDVKPLPGADGFSTEASAALEEMTRGASLLAQVTSYSDGGIPFIQLWKVLNEELVSVNRTLVDRGLATWLESV